jgi:hypothetical protein
MRRLTRVAVQMSGLTLCKLDDRPGFRVDAGREGRRPWTFFASGGPLEKDPVRVDADSAEQWLNGGSPSAACSFPSNRSNASGGGTRVPG